VEGLGQEMERAGQLLSDRRNERDRVEDRFAQARIILTTSGRSLESGKRSDFCERARRPNRLLEPRRGRTLWLLTSRTLSVV
jgi:hypothetical protein